MIVCKCLISVAFSFFTNGELSDVESGVAGIGIEKTNENLFKLSCY
jgi:hypothetical protein